MTFLIIEDEKLNANRLRKLVQEIAPHYQVVEVLHTIADGVAWLRQQQHPDIVLMDVRLADGLSFDIFEQVTINSAIIFTTAYDEYAFRAFRVNSVDYLLKPVEREELEEAIAKALQLKSKALNEASLEALLKHFRQPESTYRNRFLIPFRDGYKTIGVADIDMIYSEAKNTHLVTRDGKIEIVTQTLEELEGQLNPQQFFRANRQYLINVDSLESIQNHFHGKLKVVIRNNAHHEILISKDKAPIFKQWLDG
jgi:two-component system LytT family response regulator